MDEPDALPPEVWALFHASQPHRPWTQMPSDMCGIGHAPYIVRWGGPPIPGQDRENQRLRGVIWGGVAGGVEHVTLSAKVHHQTGCWVVGLDCSNAFNTVKH